MTGMTHPGAVLDELMANAWPPQEVERHGRWRMRWTSGVTRRANSALAIDDGGDLTEAIATAEAFYSRHRMPAAFQLSTASAPAGLAAVLTARGYRSVAATVVTRASISDVIGITAPDDWTLESTLDPTDRWFRTYWTAEPGRNVNGSDAEVCREVLLRPPLRSAYVSASRDHVMHAVGQVVVEGEWAGIQCMATVPELRRQGAASAVLHHLARRAAELGASGLYLAVMSANTGARRLYERVGFVDSHDYSYYVR